MPRIEDENQQLELWDQLAKPNLIEVRPSARVKSFDLLYVRLQLISEGLDIGCGGALRPALAEHYMGQCLSPGGIETRGRRVHLGNSAASNETKPTGVSLAPSNQTRCQTDCHWMPDTSSIVFATCS